VNHKIDQKDNTQLATHNELQSPVFARMLLVAALLDTSLTPSQFWINLANQPGPFDPKPYIAPGTPPSIIFPEEKASAAMSQSNSPKICPKKRELDVPRDIVLCGHATPRTCSTPEPEVIASEPALAAAGEN
jgi:hypothetical protein